MSCSKDKGKQECIPVGCVPAERWPYSENWRTPPPENFEDPPRKFGGTPPPENLEEHPPSPKKFETPLPPKIWRKPPPPPVNRMTDRCKTSFRPVNIGFAQWKQTHGPLTWRSATAVEPPLGRHLRLQVFTSIQNKNITRSVHMAICNSNGTSLGRSPLCAVALPPSPPFYKLLAPFRTIQFPICNYQTFVCRSI